MRAREIRQEERGTQSTRRIGQQATKQLMGQARILDATLAAPDIDLTGFGQPNAACRGMEQTPADGRLQRADLAGYGGGDRVARSPEA
jgi:hypothetical protein